MEDACLIFLHLPKTGGSTLTTLLRWQNRSPQPDEIARFITVERTFEEIDRLPLEQRATLRLLVGHFAYGVHEYVPKPCSYITIVREPVHRVISLYRYVLSAPSHHLHQTLISSSMSLEDYVGSGIHRFQTENALTRQLVGRDEEDNPTLHDLEIAKRNLRSFRAVLTEAFDERECDTIQTRPDWRTPFYLKRNVSRRGPHSDEVTTTTREFIRERNLFEEGTLRSGACPNQSACRAIQTRIQEGGQSFKLLNRVPQALGGVLDPIAPMVRRGLERRVIHRSL